MWCHTSFTIYLFPETHFRVSADSVYRKSQSPIIPLCCFRIQETRTKLSWSASLSRHVGVWASETTDSLQRTILKQNKTPSLSLCLCVSQEGRDGAYERTEEIVSSHSARNRKWQQMQCFFLFSLFWRISTSWRWKEGGFLFKTNGPKSPHVREKILRSWN
jgi:hypothetical protein